MVEILVIITKSLTAKTLKNKTPNHYSLGVLNL
jgi:hypothetical protein